MTVADGRDLRGRSGRSPAGAPFPEEPLRALDAIWTDIPWGINHFGFEVESVQAIVDATGTTAESNTFGAVAESWIRDPEGNRVDIAEHGWPI